MSEPEKTAEQAIREAAWAEAMTTRFRWEEATDRAYGRGGAGYQDPHAIAEAKRLRTVLDELVLTHGFQGTRADPMLNWVANQSASWDCPPIAEEVGR